MQRNSIKFGCCFKLGAKSDTSEPIEETPRFELWELDFTIRTWLADRDDLVVFSEVFSRTLSLCRPYTLKFRGGSCGMYLKGAFTWSMTLLEASEYFLTLILLVMEVPGMKRGLLLAGRLLDSLFCGER